MSDDLTARIAESDWTDTDLNYLVANILHGGIPERSVRQEAAAAIRTLQAILSEARAAAEAAA